ncbi:tagatose-6-phosphate kinase [Enterococcus malodoratus]|uniref:Tagatose-6-phosphate kinase n=1 Tax=Enterococcus malodoratus ATCC 43197 TaxID=1158601 RepID=R2R158_9ENTE|nr:tagatose-6-phosphate kinase [Enterococcus malodoratus]EOH74396.1 tagatose-6-phosphate kinase [Enterococcus malodoratus ATCC 43197]EOT67126.1 tagatose-6-phosphate kinase [Enterococcus malodoratus ATCC 43197]OJG58344.1 tagatose-6-phosphate kinase [Enterococcus malodoratus]SPW90995.1 tagatose-6-phosphate kinase [Enterococcus malodoratus]STD69622.1 tagatose-6-phosphate kinase [Enterococcus malodoratus]
MILTITMNPSIDISYPLAEFKLDTVNRVRNVRKTAGGKGLNVTRILKQLDADVVASGLIGGFLGEEIKKDLDQTKIAHDFLPISGETRNCIAVLHEGQQTEILESGPVITKEEAAAFLEHFEQLAKRASIISFSGSLPEGLSVDFYSQMLQRCEGKPVVLDCSGEALKEVLTGDAKPHLIKPNTEELAGLLEKPISTNAVELKAALSDSIFDGIEWIVVSMGGEGAFAKHFDKFYRVMIPKIAVVNPVGSGDATVAGLTDAIEKGFSDEAILKQGNVLGMLNAQEATTGYVELANYQTLFDQIKVEEV